MPTATGQDMDVIASIDINVLFDLFDFVYLFTLSIQTKDSATEQEKIPLKPII